jgi:polyketide biosynthesis enoyl-CoA hydratase PksI
MADALVAITHVTPAIAVLTMQDDGSKNGFTGEFTAALEAAFDAVVRDRGCRVVLLTGAGPYFSCGGTKEELLRLHRGEVRVADVTFFRLALDCELPVIAAMQGHAIGGGFVFGLYADLVVLGRENVYTTNFIRYGFTPGLGATLIVPERLGASLGRELLLTGQTYRGEELARRGVPFPVVPRAEVIEVALRQARVLAEQPRDTLSLLKECWARPLRRRLRPALAAEMRMHEQTVHRPDVAARIEAGFGNYRREGS